VTLRIGGRAAGGADTNIVSGDDDSLLATWESGDCMDSVSLVIYMLKVMQES